ncbi:tRNA modification GTPase [Tanacetum coccineum]
MTEKDVPEGRCIETIASTRVEIDAANNQLTTLPNGEKAVCTYRVAIYITYSKEEEAVRCIQSMHGYVLDVADNTLILNKDEQVGSSSPSINQPGPDANSSSTIAAILTSLGGQAIPTSHVVEYGIVCDPYGNVVDEVNLPFGLSSSARIRSIQVEDVVSCQVCGAADAATCRNSGMSSSQIFTILELA